jgi:agmatine/peptidylarginine deiminase
LSYVNFVYVNGGIVMPEFGGELAGYDLEAKAQLQAIFTDREVVSVPTGTSYEAAGTFTASHSRCRRSDRSAR